MFQLDFVFVHMLVTDGRFLSAGSNQLHQDLDVHGPNLWQEVGGLDVRKLVNLIQQCNWNKYTVINDGKSDENMTNFFLTFLFWLGFQIFALNFKVDLPSPWTSDWEMGVNLWSYEFLSKKFGRICLLLRNICLLLSNFDRGQFQSLKLNF